MRQPPFYNIDYSGSYRPFKSKKLQLTKINNIYIVLIQKLFTTLSNNIPVVGDSTVDPSRHFDYLHAYIYQPHAEYAVVESTNMVIFKFFYFRSFKKRVLAITRYHRVNWQLPLCT